jgi:hypothetical protein
MRNISARRIHRWVAVAFMLTVVANLVAWGWGPPPPWITYAPLPPLLVLMLSGLGLFVLPLVKGARQDHSPQIES